MVLSCNVSVFWSLPPFQSLKHHIKVQFSFCSLAGCCSCSTFKTKRKPWTWTQRNHEQRLICSSFFNGYFSSMSTCTFEMDPTLNMCILIGGSRWWGGGITHHTDPKNGAQIALIQRVEQRLHKSHWSKEWSTDRTDLKSGAKIA